MELSDYLDILKRRRVPFFITFAIILIISLIVAYILPPVYRSEATILIEKQDIPRDLVETTVTGYVQERIIGIKQSLITYDNLIDIAKTLNLYPDMRKRGDLSEMVALIRNSISVEMLNIQASDSKSKGQTTATVSFTVAYEAEEPKIARKVTAELANRYLAENKQSRSKQAVEVSAFLQEEAEALRKEIEKQEKALAVFKQEQRERLPELMNLNLKLYEKAEENIESSKGRILTLEDKITALKSELSLTDPRKAVTTEEGKIIQTPSQRLSALTVEFLQANTRYTPSHPDVIKLRREIEMLGGQSKSAAEASQLVTKLTQSRSKLLESRQQYSENHPDVMKLKSIVSTLETRLRNIVITGAEKSESNNIPADNPRFVALKTQLETTYSNLTEEKSKLASHREKLRVYEKRLFETPVVERDYKSLSRDYANAKAKYQELKSKQLKAKLAEQLEAGGKGERFVLTGSAYLPTSPDSPNRLGIVLLGGLLAFGGGLGSVLLGEYNDNSVRGRRGIVEIYGALPIVVIPYIQNANDAARNLKKRLLMVVVFFVLVASTLAFVHFYLKPLDELFDEPVDKRAAKAAKVVDREKKAEAAAEVVNENEKESIDK